MSKENLEKDLKDATSKLLELARESAWNTISDECLYIISETRDDIADDFFTLKKIRKQENEKKTPVPLRQIITELENFYDDLYDVNLFIYRSLPNTTIVEIQYYPKSTLDMEFYEKVRGNSPMLHCKVALPPYRKDNNPKFDINWELGGFRHRWNLFWWRWRKRGKVLPAHQPN